MDVQTAIRTKRAVRQFTGDPIPDDVLEQILRAALRSQSSKNTQPWQLIVIRDRDTLTALSTLGDFLSHVAGAAACVVFAAPNEQGWTWFDLGQCASYLQLAAPRAFSGLLPGQHLPSRRGQEAPRRTRGNGSSCPCLPWLCGPVGPAGQVGRAQAALRRGALGALGLIS